MNQTHRYKALDEKETVKVDNELQSAFMIFYYDKPEKRDKSIEILTRIFTDHIEVEWLLHVTQTLLKLKGQYKPLSAVPKTADNDILLLTDMIRKRVINSKQPPIHFPDLGNEPRWGTPMQVGQYWLKRAVVEFYTTKDTKMVYRCLFMIPEACFYEKNMKEGEGMKYFFNYLEFDKTIEQFCESNNILRQTREEFYHLYTFYLYDILPVKRRDPINSEAEHDMRKVIRALENVLARLEKYNK